MSGFPFGGSSSSPTFSFPPRSSSSPSSFGSSAPTSGFAFSSSPNPSSASSPFFSLATASVPSSWSGFSTPSSAFSAPSSPFWATSTPSFFAGSSTFAPASSLFGSSASTSSLFGSSTSSASFGSSSLFSSPLFSGANSGSSLFGASSSAASSGTSLFAGASSVAASRSSLFGASSASSPSTTVSSSVPAFGVSSSSASTASTANAASSGSEGSFTVVDVTDSMAPSGTTTSAAAFSFSTNASTPASSIPVLSSITTPAFDTDSVGVSTSASAAPATSISSTTAGQTSSSLVVASTSGTTSSVSASVTPEPKLPSEITGKTVEEMIKEWNAKLQERTEKFRKRANAIADWDRMILQNHDVLLRLEIEAAKVVETHANLVQQLESIETHQQEVDKALQSMEGEAERIYKDERGLLLDDEAASTKDAMYEQPEFTERELEQMTEQIKSTIQSLNASQGGELQTPDGMNPLDAVVEILNSQLTSLKWIDEKAIKSTTLHLDTNNLLQMGFLESINPNVDQPLNCTVSSKGSSTGTEIVHEIESPKEDLSKNSQSSSEGTYDMDVIKARKLIEEMTPSLEENRKTLLRKIFIKYPNLMNMNPDWWPELIVHLFRTLSSLLVLMTDTSPSIMDDASKRILVLMIGELELHNFDNTFISDMKDLVSKAWESHLVSDNLREEAKKLQARLHVIEGLLEREKGPIISI